MFPFRSIRRLPHLLGAAALLATASCGLKGPQPPLPPAPADQGWTAEQRKAWYEGSQGSRLIPESWLRALEAPGSEVAFMAPAHFDRFNYPRARPADPWPIGFARDVQKDGKLSVTRLRWFARQKDREPWIGLNCAACHTARITHAGAVHLIDGGPTLADFQGFTDTLTQALRATSVDPAKFDRFARRVLAAPASDTPRDRAMLKAALDSLLAHQDELAAANATRAVYGHGRLDAVGHILNKVAWLNRSPDQLRGEPDAPVSYPFIWNISQHDRLQWNGIVPNDKIMLGTDRSIDAGALVRNVSEVIGVFADVQVRGKPGLAGFRSSVNVENLVDMEGQLANLYSPAWPFAKPDPLEVRYGQRLFKRQCAGCHADLPRNDIRTSFKADMTPIWGPLGLGTDPWMACNAYTYRARGGVLTDTKDRILAGDPLPALGPTHGFLGTQAIGILLGRKADVVVSALKIAAGREPEIDVAPAVPPPPPPPGIVEQLSREERLAKCIADATSLERSQEDQLLLAYKARPLGGIWATAPYLHNGSVRTLWDLLLAPAKRPTRFWVGNPEFDIERVGYVGTPSAVGSWFSTTDAAGRAIHGNSNLGHDYGNALLTDADRRALVAYMKTL